MLDPLTIVKTAGMIGIFLMIFSESGLFFGFIFPGDTLLFAAGIFASQGYLSISTLLIGCIIAAILGDTIGYWVGNKMGRKLFRGNTNFFFKLARLEEAERFYQKHGKSTIILARFIPVIRTFAPIVAGIGNMRYKVFALYNVIGGIFWVLVMVLLGYFLGSIIPDPDTYILPVVLIIFVLSFLPIIFKLFPRRKR